MHPTAMNNGKMFFDTYVVGRHGVLIIDIGAQDITGSLRSFCPDGEGIQYVGVDFAEGNGVDVVLTDPYALPFDDETADIVISSSCLEHSEMFWLVFNEIMRILRPDGLLYLNVPSNGAFHRYPVDCWRFYPDSGNALVSWARRSGMNPALLESYVSRQLDDNWNDFVAVFVKDQAQAVNYPRRIIDTFTDFNNGWRYGDAVIHNAATMPEVDQFVQALQSARADMMLEADQYMQTLETAHTAMLVLQERATRAERELARMSSSSGEGGTTSLFPSVDTR